MIARLLNEIEGITFATSLSVISGFRAFQRELENNSMLNSLVDDLQRTPKHRQVVAQRIITLLAIDSTPAVEHPHDIALSAYLFALNKVDPASARDIAPTLLETSNLWWAKRLANLITENAIPASVQAT